MHLNDKINNIKNEIKDVNLNEKLNKTHKEYSSTLIINLFALAHALTAIMARLVQYTDDVPLTLLTIAMIVILSIRHRLDTKTAAIITFLGCFAGYAAGSYGEKLTLLIINNEAIASGLTTAIITEITGWMIYIFGKVVKNQKKEPVWSLTTKHILIIATIVLLLRISYTILFNTSYFADEGIHFEFQRIFNNTPAVLFLICSNIIFASLTHRKIQNEPSAQKNQSKEKLKDYPVYRLAKIIFITLIIAFIVALITFYNLSEYFGYKIFSLAFLRVFAAAILLNIILYGVLRLAAFASVANAEIGFQKEKKHMAQYRYNRLKTQINPHFLFNSLNILDYLVQEEETERASNFIHKLAGTYRYMLQTEDKKVVTIKEELDFARKYIDLLKERFIVGFIINVNIPEDQLNRFVIPCTLQLLIENAIKHNAVNKDNPLIINISIKNNHLVVQNNLCPKLTRPNSTGKGLKNIQQQYNDIAGKEVTIIHSPTEFVVSLPLF